MEQGERKLLEIKELRKESDYAVVCVSEFAKSKKLSTKEAYIYLHDFKGIDFLKECYDIEHTLSFDDVVEDLTRICQNNGGTLE